MAKLREAEVELAKGTPVAQVRKRIGVTEQTWAGSPFRAHGRQRGVRHRLMLLSAFA
jgi:hypothetical protein